ncbi:hypothetical protein B0T26DRAFT_673176 [Lasiosphaeria miniovina]|uniref:Calcofluor white hypersensitive protein n=1 Tax=Lasiosphaeria miniovina TaxID=1954250 RepID=A0AA40B6P5_9PEZI|nr:uncharacterized protein B0T26DRAFT_673176 [Lasiosphaeria miniovina]KAK0728686.1 hypothetical protein B0T26DRAFT_673176 [Lasiosphaeria miniovina]
MSRSRAPLALGLAAAGGVGYYLYSAGGSPKAAEKKFESDAHRVAATIKGEVPRSGVGAEAEGKKYGQEVGVKVDSAVATTNRDLSKAKSEAEAYAKNAKAETLKKIDEIDRKVEEGAAKSKSYLSSWFGGK